MMDGSAVTFRVGDIPVVGDKILAPMDGFSDLPFRVLARQLGSAVSYSEFISAIDLLHHHPRALQRLPYEESERPVAFQVFDHDPARLLKAAQMLQERKPDYLDVNMGCSVSAVAGRGAGAGLLREPRKVAEIMRSLSQALDIPVTAKIRLGWDEDSLNYLEIARIIEENGGKLIAVHARTRAQRYTGEADWDAIAEIKQAVSIPVIGNGDVKSAADVARLKAHTGCDAVMIGRAAVGNPWIFQGRERHEVPPEEVRSLVEIHLARMLAFYGEPLGLVLFRKHISGYLSPYRLNREQRVALYNCETKQAFTALLKDIQDIHLFPKEEAYANQA